MEREDRDCHEPKVLDSVVVFESTNHPDMEDESQQEEGCCEQDIAPQRFAERADSKYKSRELQNSGCAKKGGCAHPQEPSENKDVERVMEPASQDRDASAVIDGAQRQIQREIRDEKAYHSCLPSFLYA